MATFESMDRRMPKIEACLKANGLESLDACNEMLLAKGIDLSLIHISAPSTRWRACLAPGRP